MDRVLQLVHQPVEAEVLDAREKLHLHGQGREDVGFLKKAHFPGYLAELGSPTPLPESLTLPALKAWGESQFGVVSVEYWRAFWKAAVKLELQRASASEYSLAARPALPREEKS